MTQKIDELHTYFRTLKTVNPEYPNSIDENSLDQFLYTITQFFFNCLENGFSKIDCTTIELKENNVKEYFITGFTCIRNGMEPLAIETIMEYLTLLYSTKDMSYQELLEIKFIEKTLKLIQHSQINEYLYLLEQFCSKKTSNKIQKDFKNK
jgi:hypothetical protein